MGKFADLAKRARRKWSSEAHEVYEAATKHFEQEAEPPKPNVRIIDVRNGERVRLLQEDSDEYFRRYPMPRFGF